MCRFVFLFCLTLPLAAQQGPVNLSFEDSGPEGKPTGWAWVQTSSYSAAMVENCRTPDSRCAEVRRQGGHPGGHPGDITAAGRGFIMQSFDATALRGKQVRYRAWLRLDTPTLGGAQLFMRVERPAGAVGFNSYSQRPKDRSRDWTLSEIAGTIDADATRVTIGLFFAGLGSASIADAEFDIVDGL